MELDGRWSELSGWLTTYPEEMVLKIWEFLKDSWSTRFFFIFLFFYLIKADQFGSRQAEMGCDLRHHKMGSESGGSIVYDFYDLSLSPRVAKNWR